MWAGRAGRAEWLSRPRPFGARSAATQSDNSYQPQCSGRIIVKGRILYLIEQKNDHLEKCHGGLLCASHPSCAGSGSRMLGGSGNMVPLQLRLEERACPKPQCCLSFNPLTRLVLLV